MKKILTLAFLLRNNGGAALGRSEATGKGRSSVISDEEICLAMKKRGFGVGYWNGYGGKVEEGETTLAAAVREIKEESGVEVNERDLFEVALVDFIFEDGKHLEVHTFFTRKWSGEPVETEEMRPKWYAFDAIPYKSMWADDLHWLPRCLKGEKLRGTVYFNTDGKSIKDMTWRNAD